ncbi:MAG TPA: sialidase family protein [bacterium]|nr:sialidase family protein [bacterium]
MDKQAVQRLSISNDGGKTFPRQNITVATVTDNFVSPAPGSSFRQDARAFPSFTIAPSGALYVAWSNRTGDPTGGHAVVLLAKSTTGGLTWTTPVVAGNVTGRSAFFASVAADPLNRVNVVFQAMDDVATGTAPGPGVVNYDAFFTQSTNGGATFSTPLMISTATSDPDGSSTNSLRAQFLGDYITAVADASHVYAVWTDSRNATPCDAVDAFRATQNVADKPNVIGQCPTTFGNTDIVLGTVTP